MVPKVDSGAFLLLFLLVLTITEPLRPGVPRDQRPYHGKENGDSRPSRGRGGDATRPHAVNEAQPVRFSRKCPTGWHHYEGTASCYRVYLSGENYWDAVQTCQRANGSLATFSTDQELRFILAQEWDLEAGPFARKDQRRFWVGYQYVITSRNRSVEGRWEVAYKGSSEVFLPPDPIFGPAMSESEKVLCAQLQCFHFPTLRHHGLHSWYAENCYEKSSFLCKRSQTCVDIKDNIVDEGSSFTPKGDDPCLSCTCHNGEAEMCVAALCERPQGCQQYRKDPKECCKFMCLDPDGNSLFDSMASGMRLIVSCISSFLILSLLLFMVHRLRQRRRERIESLIGANLHHFHLGRRMPGFDYGPDGFGTGLTPLHLSDDGEGGAFHFHDPPPPYTAYKYPEIQHPDDPPPPYEASIGPDSHGCCAAPDDTPPPPAQSVRPPLGDASTVSPRLPGDPLPAPGDPSPTELEDSAPGSTLLAPPGPAPSEHAPTETVAGRCPSPCSLDTTV
ncbi:integral membrane protein DGCR2/IDD isoform X4 [Ornithorhynchus anatinus]|uniref:integral membrane protein DGCR2/IDD isoform X4 n=1 Tax=Ornithorhynchus anatinus TaxID=9258 RepID=UPI0010A7696A|nr:integral membrane protein DGCR2/IDD isoform X4 [Ornithorhynchus anatinus]